MDLVLAAVEEVAFEGLEGSTFARLIENLENRTPPVETTIDDDVKKFLWDGLSEFGEIQYFYVDENQLTATSEQSDNSQKNSNEKKRDDNEPLPPNWICDKEGSIYGFSQYYNIRKDVTEEVNRMDYTEATEKYGNSLYLVGSQQLRLRTLTGENFISTMSTVLNPLRYVMLEVIAKTRAQGFIQVDFKKYNFDPRSTFHHVKILNKCELVTKQTRVSSKSGRCHVTKILYHKNFHQQSAIKSAALATRICSVLSEAPNCALETKELKEKVGEMSNHFKKIKRWLLINEYIQYIYDGKIIKADPNIRIQQSKPYYVQLVRMFEPEHLEDGRDDDEEDDYVLRCKSIVPLMVNEMNINQQTHLVMASRREEGVTLNDLAERLCVPHFWGRSLLHNICVSKWSSAIMMTKNRQRLIKSVSMMFLHENKTVQFISEASKTTGLTLAKESTKRCTPPAIEDKEKMDDAEAEVKMEDNVNEKTEGENTKAQKSKQGKTICPRTSNERLAASLELRTLRKTEGQTKDIRYMSREKYILDTIKEVGVVDDAVSLYKGLLKHEGKEQKKCRCCRKSFYRILAKLEKTNKLNAHRFTIGKFLDNKIVLYCGPTMGRDDENVVKTLEQCKFRLATNLREMRRQNASEKAKGKKKQSQSETQYENFQRSGDEVCSSDNYIPDTDTDEESKMSFIKRSERHEYGYLPRFRRIKYLHLFLWQLIYGKRNAEGHTVFDGSKNDNLENEQVSDYSSLNIRRKLPSYIDGIGWFKIGDVLSLMPLILFSQCGGIRVESKTFLQFLKDPKKRMIFTSQLPPNLRAKILNSKEGSHILQSFIDCMVYMVQMGLVRVKGETLPINRSQIMLYLTKETLLYDTTESEKSYYCVVLPPGMESFPVHHYQFDSLDDVFKYWSDVEFVCQHTPLGYRMKNRDQPNRVTGQQTKRKGKIICAFSTLRDFRTLFNEANVAKCKPALVGDGLGAGGFDSSFFAHLSRNWTDQVYGKKPSKYVRKKSEKQEEVIDTALSIPAMAIGKQKHLRRKKRHAEGIVTERKGKKRKRVSFSTLGKNITYKTNRRLEDVVASRLLALHQRREAQKKKRLEGRNTHKVDAKDHLALKARKSLRAAFSVREDAYVFQAAIAMKIMGLIVKKHNPWDIVRDMIHDELEESKDKTIMSLARRSRQQLKNSESRAVLRSCVVECLGYAEFAESQKWTASNWRETFRNLFTNVRKKYKDRDSPMDISFEFPSGIEELRQGYLLVEMKDPEPAQPISEPKTPSEVTRIVLRDLVHNSIGGRYGPDFVPSMVYRIFKRYSRRDIDFVVSEMRKLGLISRVRYDVPRYRCLPLSTLRYDLSTTYDRITESLLPIKAWIAAKRMHKEMLKQLSPDDSNGQLAEMKESESMEFSFKNGYFHNNPNASYGGTILHILSLLARNEVMVNIDFPNRVVRSKIEEEPFSTDLISEEGGSEATDSVNHTALCELMDEQNKGTKPSCVRIGLKRKPSNRDIESPDNKRLCTLKRVDSTGSCFSVNFAYVSPNTVMSFQRTSHDTSHVDFDYLDQQHTSALKDDVNEEYQPYRKFLPAAPTMLQKADRSSSLMRPMSMKPDDFFLTPCGVKCKLDIKPFYEFFRTKDQGGHHIYTDNIETEEGIGRLTQRNGVDEAGGNVDVFVQKKENNFSKNVEGKCSILSANEDPSVVARFLKTSDIIAWDSHMEQALHSSVDNDTYSAALREFYLYGDRDITLNLKLLEGIRNGKELGLPVSDAMDLYLEYCTGGKTDRSLQEHLSSLQDFRLVMEVGVIEKRYVALEFSENWCMRTPMLPNTASCGFIEDDLSQSGTVNQKDSISTPEQEEGCSSFQSSQDKARNQEETSYFDKNNQYGAPIVPLCENENIDLRSSTPDLVGDLGPIKKKEECIGGLNSIKRKLKEDLEQPIPNKQKKSTNEELEGDTNRPEITSSNIDSGRRIKRLRPWLGLDGEFSTTLLKRFQMCILSYIIFNPGLRKNDIYKRYNTLLRPVAIDDILDFLLVNGSITEHFCPESRPKRGLFEQNADQAELTKSDSYYLPTLSCVFNLVDDYRDH